MIRFLQKSGQTTKYVLGGLLLIICASMVITLIPGGLGGDVFTNTPGKGVIAKAAIKRHKSLLDVIAGWLVSPA